MHVLVMKLKRLVRIWLLFNADRCSATSMESSRRVLLNDMAEHRTSLEKTKMRTTPILVSNPQVAFPETRVLFLL